MKNENLILIVPKENLTTVQGAKRYREKITLCAETGEYKNIFLLAYQEGIYIGNKLKNDLNEMIVEVFKRSYDDTHERLYVRKNEECNPDTDYSFPYRILLEFFEENAIFSVDLMGDDCYNFYQKLCADLESKNIAINLLMSDF